MACDNNFRYSIIPRELPRTINDEWVANMERRDRDIEDYLNSIPCGADTRWAIFTRTVTDNLSSGALTGTLTLAASDGLGAGTLGDWATDGTNISHPEPGIYAWHYNANVDTTTSLTTTNPITNGCGWAWWQWEVQPLSLDAGIPIAITHHEPIIYDGTSLVENGYSWFKSGLYPLLDGGSADSYFLLSVTPMGYPGACSGTVGWDEAIIVVRESDAPPYTPPE
jgi:hypothetical protein